MDFFRFITRSIRTKLLLSVGLGTTAVLILFIGTVAIQERNDLIATNKDFGLKLATSLANSTALFLASHDIVRLQEISDAQHRYKDLDYVIFTDETGEVLAHTDTTKIGLYLVDLPVKTSPQFFSVKEYDFTDVLHPVYFDSKHVGWIRLGINQNTAAEKLKSIVSKGLIYLLLALLISFVIAYFTARHITSRIRMIEKSIKSVKAGDENARTQLKGFDETSRLAESFDEMLDVLQEKEVSLLKSRHQFEELFNAAPVAMVFLQQNPGITIANKAFSELFGYSEEDILDMENWWQVAYPDEAYRQQSRIRWEQEIAKAAATQQPITPKEFQIKAKNGDFKTVLISGKFIEDLLLVVFYDITERKQAENLMRNLLEEAERLRTALDLVPSYIFIKDKNLVYNYANKQTLSYFGITEKDLHRVKNEDIFPPEAAAEIKLLDEEVLKGNTTMKEIPVKGEDGTLRYFIDVKTPIKDEKSNEIIGIVGISTDITAQKVLAENEMKEREKLQIIASRLPGMIYQFRMRPDGSVSFPYVSDAIREIYEVEPEAVKDDASVIFKNVHPEDLEKGLASIQLSASTLKPWVYEYRYITRNGAVKYLKGNAVPQREEDGSVLWHGFINDATEMKIAELELNKTLELNNNILKMVPAGIFWKDRELRYIGCNDVFIKNLGISDVKELIGKDDFALTTKEAAEKYRKDDLRVIETETPIYGLKESFMMPDGSKKHILTNKTPLRNAHGEVIGVLGSYIDITALTVTEEMLQTTSRLYLLISQLNQMFIRQKEEAALLQETCNMAVKYGGFLMCWIGKADEATGKVEPLYVAGKEEGYLTSIKNITIKNVPEGLGPTGTSIRERRLVYTQDIAIDPMMKPWREEALKRGFRSALSVPIIVADKVEYTISFYSSKPHHFNDEKETVLIQEIADDLSFSLNALHLEKQKQKAEKRVEDYSYALNESAIVDIADSEGRMIFANENFYRVTGYSQDEIIGMDHKILNSGYHHKRVYQGLWSTLQRGEVWRGELRNKAKDGHLFWVDTTIVPFLDESGKPFQFISIRSDITERKNAEAEKMQVLERFELLSEATSDTIWDWDVQNNSVLYSQGLTKNYGHKQRTFKDDHLEWFKAHVHPDDWDAVSNKIQRAFRLHHHKIQDDYRFLCADGTYKYVQDRAFVIYDENKQPLRVIGSMQDVTKERELNQQIENAVIRAQEKEWNQLGMELHDNVNQILAASIIYINFAQEKIKGGKDALIEVTKSEEMIRSAIQEIRRLSHQLAPASVEKMNIRQVIETLAEAVAPNQHFKIHLDLEQTGELPMTANLQTQLYRILQEQFNNIIKHSHAKNVTISLRKTDDALVLKIIDDGKGQDTTKAKGAGGIGLENIRRRVTMFGGNLRITTAAGKGYTMEIDIPLAHI